MRTLALILSLTILNNSVRYLDNEKGHHVSFLQNLLFLQLQGTKCDTVLGNFQRDTVAAAINAVPTNGTSVICFPSGTETYTNSLGWTNKNIKLVGSGAGRTRINSTLTAGFIITVGPSNSGAAVRISGMTLAYSNANPWINFRNLSATVLTGSYTNGWRIDHNEFIASRWDGAIVFIEGLTAGLIDNNVFTHAPGVSCAFPFKLDPYTNPDFDQRLSGEPMFNGMTAMNRSSDDIFTETLYFENNVVNCATSVGNSPFLNDSLFGGKFVVRYNIINGGSMQTHSTRGPDYGGLMSVVYRNVFTASNARFMLLRSGRGIFFDNQVIGTATSIDIDSARFPGTVVSCMVNGAPSGLASNTNPYDSTTESSGWPAMNQPGRGGGLRGFQQPWEPIIAWKNGTASTCATGGTCGNETQIALNGGCGGALMAPYLKTVGSPHVNGEVDYVNPANVSEGTVFPSSCTKGQVFRKMNEGNNGLGVFYLATSGSPCTWTLHYTPKGTHPLRS